MRDDDGCAISGAAAVIVQQLLLVQLQSSCSCNKSIHVSFSSSSSTSLFVPHGHHHGHLLIIIPHALLLTTNVRHDVNDEATLLASSTRASVLRRACTPCSVVMTPPCDWSGIGVDCR